MRRVVVWLAILAALIVAQESSLSDITVQIDAGTKAYQENRRDEAKSSFVSAKNSLENMMKGVLAPEDAAYVLYYLATTKYYIARIDKDQTLFEEASKNFSEVANSFKGLGIVGEEYARSKYMRALCSFRLYQLAAHENFQLKKLDDAVGDFSDFLQDSIIQANAQDFLELLENAKYFFGYCKFVIGNIKRFNPALYGDADKMFTESASAFAECKKASNEELAIASAFMEAFCHYARARLFMRVHADDWKQTKLASGERHEAISEELNQANSLFDKMISSASAKKELQMLGKVSQLVLKIAKGSIGEKEELVSAINAMTDMRNDAKWGGEMLIRIADASLINFLIYGATAQTAQNALNRVTDSYPMSAYWLGFSHYIAGEYDRAEGYFSTAVSRVTGKSDRRSLELLADAKFRQAECLFWNGVKQGNIGLLQQAKNIYTALDNPQGQYYPYLSQEALAVIRTRGFLISIESSLGKETDFKKLKDMFEGAVAIAGLSLPKDVDRYLEVGKYFLQKGIETAERERESAVRLAAYAFDKVISSSVPAEAKNKARFMKGVALVKLATVIEEKDAPAEIENAKAELDQCASPYSDEAKYVLGVGYFNINNYASATPILESLKNKGHRRAAYHFALTKEKTDCVTAATVLKTVMNSIKDRTDPWYLRADREFSGLSCRGSAGAGATLPPYTDAPMTYENLVDKTAEEERRKQEALYVWQKASMDLPIPDIEVLIPDKPPETNVKIELVIDPPGGEEEVFVDGKTGVLQSQENSVYKGVLSRGTHKVKVRKRGFYLLDQSIKVARSERITLSMKKAVRYVSAGAISGTRRAVATTSDGTNVYAASIDEFEISAFSSSGSKIKTEKLSKFVVGSVGGMAYDDGKIILTDPLRNQVVSVDENLNEVTIIAYGNEPYGTATLSRPAGVAAKQGFYYIVDSGNRRIVVFEGKSFRKAFGDENLQQPIGIAILGDTIIVADIGKGKIVMFSSGGEHIGDIALPEQTLPYDVFVDADGFIFVSDYLKDTIIKYTSGFLPISTAAQDVTFPRSIAQVGSGPESVVFVASEDGLVMLKGSWDNSFMPPGQ